MKNFLSEIIQVIILISLLINSPTKCSEAIILKLSYNYSTYMESPLMMYLYTLSQIASPKMNIYTYIRSDKKQNLFYIYEVLYNVKDSEKNNYYNYTKSNSFQNISCLGTVYVKSFKDIHAKEKFFFNVYNDKTKLNKEIEVELDFILGVDLLSLNDRVYFLNMGFPVVNDKTISDRFKFDMVIQLKQKNIIDNYNWFIFYGDEFNKGEEVIKAEEISKLNPVLLIGTLPHYYNKKKFYESQLLNTYSNLYFWSITFKDIYIYKYSPTGEKSKLSTFADVVEIYLDDIMIYGPMYYITMVKTEFFNKYKSCKSYKDPEIRYYCEKNENFGIDELKLFPSLFLDQAFLNYTFELTYKDLFIEMDDKYHFLVVPNSDDETWSIGYSLLKKYQFVFNQDSRTVGFYNPNLPKEGEEEEQEQSDSTDNTDKKEEEKGKDKEKEKEEEEEEEIYNNNKEEVKEISDDKNSKDNNSKVKKSGLSIEIIIIIICGSGILFIAVGILIGKFIFKKMKGRKRINELEENYDYFSSQMAIND